MERESQLIDDFLMTLRGVIQSDTCLTKQLPEFALIIDVDEYLKTFVFNKAERELKEENQEITNCKNIIKFKNNSIFRLLKGENPQSLYLQNLIVVQGDIEIIYFNLLLDKVLRYGN